MDLGGWTQTVDVAVTMWVTSSVTVTVLTPRLWRGTEKTPAKSEAVKTTVENFIVNCDDEDDLVVVVVVV